MIDDISRVFELLFHKNNNIAYKALQELQEESKRSNLVYGFIDRLSDMIDDNNSYIRTRGLVLIAYNSKWDINCKIDEAIDRYLEHIADIKPITARQCIKMLAIIAENKPDLEVVILRALKKANILIYPESMQTLIKADIRDTIQKIENINNNKL